MGVLKFVFPHDVVVSELERRRFSIVPAKGDKGDPPVRGVDYWTAADVEAMEADVTERLLAVLAPQATESGEMVAVSDALAEPAEALKVTLKAAQSGSGTPAPDNVRSISGWTAAAIGRGGANLAPAFGAEVRAGLTLTPLEGGALMLDGTATAAAVFNSANITVVPGREYYIGGCPAGGGFSSWRIDVRDTTGAVISGAPIDNGAGGGTWTVPSGVSTIRLGIRVASGATLGALVFRPVVVPAADCERLTVTLPTDAGTVYGGTLDAVAGVLTVTHGAFTASSAEAADSTGKVFRVASRSDAVAASAGAAAAIVCDRFGVYTLGALRGDGVTDGICQNQAQFFVKRSGCATLAETTAWLAENPVTVVYPLATPVTYSLDAVMLEMLRGENTLWADAGALSVTYRADIFARLEAEISELRALVLENVGD